MYRNRIQMLNPKTKHWVKINTENARIIGHKWDDKPYKNVEIHPDYKNKLKGVGKMKEYPIAVKPYMRNGEMIKGHFRRKPRNKRKEWKW